MNEKCSKTSCVCFLFDEITKMDPQRKDESVLCAKNSYCRIKDNKLTCAQTSIVHEKKCLSDNCFCGFNKENEYEKICSRDEICIENLPFCASKITKVDEVVETQKQKICYQDLNNESSKYEVCF